MLARSLANAEQYTFGARIMNPGYSDVHISAGTVVALFVPVSDYEPREPVLHVQHVSTEDSLPEHLYEMFENSNTNLNDAQRSSFKSYY